MAWTAPKTTWTETSYFNASDYNRIKNNLVELRSMLPVPIDFVVMGADKAVGDLFYADEVNKFWTNMGYICAAVDYSLGEYRIYQPNEPIMFAAELNRLERTIADVYSMLVGNIPVYAIDSNGVYAASNDMRAKARAS